MSLEPLRATLEQMYFLMDDGNECSSRTTLVLQLNDHVDSHTNGKQTSPRVLPQATQPPLTAACLSGTGTSEEAVSCMTLPVSSRLRVLDVRVRVRAGRAPLVTIICYNTWTFVLSNFQVGLAVLTEGCLRKPGSLSQGSLQIVTECITDCYKNPVNLL